MVALRRMVTLFAQARTAIPDVQKYQLVKRLLAVKATRVFALSLTQRTKSLVINTRVHQDGIV